MFRRNNRGIRGRHPFTGKKTDPARTRRGLAKSLEGFFDAARPLAASAAAINAFPQETEAVKIIRPA